jgi:GAF domain-containing protein
MQIPPIPPDENSRIEVLRALNILDTPAEERFDRLTRLARRVFNVPISTVTMVDSNRQWFKSCGGVDVRETPREISFCAHAILYDDMLVVENAAKDDRFRDNPFVTEKPKIRFYAGCPLVVNGYRIGTICVIDMKARAFADEDRQLLRDLARLAERELAFTESRSVTAV